MRVLSLLLAGVTLATAADPYTSVSVPVPAARVPEISGIELMPDNKIAIATRRGDIFVSDKLLEDPIPADPGWTVYAEGLHEPLGLSFRDGWLYATQRPEVTRMKDSDGDGRADIFESIVSDWGIDGDYHEYAFGSRHDQDGNILVALCLTGSVKAESDFRGWVVRITPDGRMIPTATGVRSPGGIAQSADGEFFYTDNQGYWNGSSSLKHIVPGGFMGNPVGLNSFDLAGGFVGVRPNEPESGSRIEDQRKRIPQLVPPAVIFPHGKVGQSPAGIALDDTGGKFGPFEGQLFVAEQTHSEIQRVFLEKVKGVYQGAVFKFLEGFPSGNIIVRFAPDGSLFTAGTNRGWGARGGEPFGLDRIRWNGETPHEIKEMRVTPDGFDLEFTKPVDKSEAQKKDNYVFSSYTYIYQKGYGSPEVDKSEPKVSKVEVSPDRLTVKLKVSGRIKGHVHQLDIAKLGLAHSTAYYTLNEIPN